MRASLSKRLPNKAQRDVWRNVNQANLPLRTLKKPATWGADRSGRDIGEYSPEQFRQRSAKRVTLTALEVLHRAFLGKRERAADRFVHADTAAAFVLSEDDVEEERLRRKEMAALRMELYGQKADPYELDPEWDDVVPMPADEPEGALAAIAYPDNYAEGKASAPPHLSACQQLAADGAALPPQPYRICGQSWSRRSTRPAVSG